MLYNLSKISCADPESFIRGGPTLTFFVCYLVDEGREDPNITIRWPASEWPNIECWLGSFVLFRGSGPVLLRNPILL